MSYPGVDLGHTPGLYYALAYWIGGMVFGSIYGSRRPDRRFWAVLVGFTALLFSFMVLTDGVSGLGFVLSMLVIFGMIFLFFLVGGRFPWRNALYFAMRCFIMGEFAASFEWQMFYYGLNSLGFPLNMMVNVIFLITVHPVVFGLLYLIEYRYRDRGGMTLTDRELIPVLLLGLFIFLLSNLSFAAPNTPFSSHSAPDIFAIRTLADFAGVGLLLAYHLQLCEMSANMEKEYLNKLLRMQEENYRISAESVELVNRKYHDLKHQLQLLRGEISTGEKLRYLDEMEREIRSYETQNKTGNRALDLILTAKTLQCQNEGISLTCVADGKELACLRETDISVLFGNALDNAIESVEKLADREKRLIHVSVARQKGFLRIRVENCCGEELHFVDGLPSTTKRDPRYHGYGMKSIRSIVEKYSGSMTVKVQDGWFELRILLPLAPTGED